MTIENEPTPATGETGADEATADPAEAPPPRRRRAASRPAGPPQPEGGEEAPAPERAPAKKTTRKRAAKKAAPEPDATPAAEAAADDAPAPRKRAPRKRAVAPVAAPPPTEAAEPATEPAVESADGPTPESVTEVPSTEPLVTEPLAADVPPAAEQTERGAAASAPPATAVLFQAPEPAPAPRRRRAASRPAGPPQPVEEAPAESAPPEPAAAPVTSQRDAGGEHAAGTEVEQGPEVGGEGDDEGGEGRRRRRRRGGRGRRRRSGAESENGQDGEDGSTDEQGGQGEDRDGEDREHGAPEAKPREGGSEQARARGSAEQTPDEDQDDGAEDGEGEEGGTSRRRRRRRRRGGGSDGDADAGPDDPPNTVVKVRQPRGDDVTAVKGSTRLEAKRQRRREGRDSGRRRPIITEAEFLARRESVERVMLVRERHGRTQIAVLEDGVLVEHYVARKAQASMIGNVYLGKVQNVLPSMEAAFVDIGKGRNAVLYAGEVNWDAAGLEGQPKRIELALKSGDPVLVQVTKDPVGHKGARLTSQVSLPGRYLVYVPRSSMTGISRKLPDTERNRLKKILKSVLPEDAGVIVRTAAEGASEDELSRDVARLTSQWEDIEKRAKAVTPPTMLHGEPDLTTKVVRDVFNEDFTKLVVSGDEAWETVREYVSWVAPDLEQRLEHWDGEQDVFAANRVDEQIAKALERKVWLPSGGSLVIDRTEAMTVVDVNTGKFTGSGGNLEETVTRNNLEAAEEIVRQLRLRDIGGIIVVDFIDMVLESNRDLVLRRLLECLGRDRTKHQVAEVTSLGLVQMTRKRVGQGLIEAFSEPCEHCGGRGVVLHDEPVEKQGSSGAAPSGSQKRRGSARDVAAATVRASRSEPAAEQAVDQPGEPRQEPDPV